MSWRKTSSTTAVDQRSTQDGLLKKSLLHAAQLIDLGRTEGAINVLTNLPADDGSPASRRLAASLWKRALQMQAAETGMPTGQLNRGLHFIDQCVAVIGGGNVWLLYDALGKAERDLGSQTLAGVLTSLLWDVLPTAHFGFQHEILARVYLGGEAGGYQSLWSHLLRADRGFVPNYWQFQALAKSWSESGQHDVVRSTRALLKAAGRTDLDRLFDVYILLLRQLDIPKALRLTRELSHPEQRRRMSDYLLGVSMTAENLSLAVDVHKRLTIDRPASEAACETEFMQARLALANEDWDGVLTNTAKAVTYGETKYPAICLRALAHARKGDIKRSSEALRYARHSEKAPWFIKGRAALINVSRRLVEDGQPQPNDLPCPALPVMAGRPLAQSLWVGPRLRWIEEMSIRSFLLNGWRYQLYVYDIPENVPDGVEIMDASAILPRNLLFAEGSGSGIHKGSIGAFSDLFRYALIVRRGGMWTDTDVINFRRFEPDGERFVCTEFTDAGMIGVNGAMMAAPADDPLQRCALDMAMRISDTGNVFFTRIGPQLLAELLGDGGLQGYRLMPTAFLNPVGWMETGALLAPFEQTAARRDITAAPNLHVYTETWRLIGLDLTAPPKGDFFLARLYETLMNETPGRSGDVRELMQKLAA